jgi:hypothetical protein
MIPLKEDTATSVKIGPFLDSTDGVTAETGLTISQADVRLSKNGGDFAQKDNASAATHDENGWYDCPLSTTDTNTAGSLVLAVAESGALPVWHEFMVLPANVYDSLFSTDRLQVDVRELGLSTLGLTTQMKADVNAEADSALSDGGYSSTRAGYLDLLNSGVALSAAGIDAILDDVLEGTLTFRQAQRILLAVLAGISTGGGTSTVNFRDVANAKNRVVATVDNKGNRDAITLDGS